MSKKDFRDLSLEERTELARHIKRARLELGLKQADVAKHAHVSRQTLSDAENGKAVPQGAVLQRIMETLGMTLPDSGQTSDETRMWLGLIEGVLEAIPVERRSAAGKAALDAVTNALVANVRPRGEDEEPVDITRYALAAKRGPRKADQHPHAE